LALAATSTTRTTAPLKAPAARSAGAAPSLIHARAGRGRRRALRPLERLAHWLIQCALSHVAVWRDGRSVLPLQCNIATAYNDTAAPYRYVKFGVHWGSWKGPPRRPGGGASRGHRGIAYQYARR
jgi:hypothetical protein